MHNTEEESMQNTGIEYSNVYTIQWGKTCTIIYIQYSAVMYAIMKVKQSAVMHA